MAKTKAIEDMSLAQLDAAILKVSNQRDELREQGDALTKRRDMLLLQEQDQGKSDAELLAERERLDQVIRARGL